MIINRQELNSIEFEKESVEIPVSPGREEGFEILITNPGSPTHIHLSVSEELKGSISFLQENPYVLESEHVQAVACAPADGRAPIEGQLFITAGYGSKKKGFPVRLGTTVEKTGTVPSEAEDCNLTPEENTPLTPYKPYRNSAWNNRAIGLEGHGLLGISGSILDKLTGNRSGQNAGRMFSHSFGNADRTCVTLAFGMVLAFLLFFALYFLLPESLEYSVSFYQALVFSMLFIGSSGYLMIKIMQSR